MKFINFFLLLFALSIFTSCGDDVDCQDSAAIIASIEDELDAVLAATQAFSTDPSSSNCQKLIDATQDYIDAAKDLQGCADEAGVGAEFRADIQEAEDNLDMLTC